MFGPYFKKSDEIKWHWIKECPEFPKDGDSRAMISSKKPDENTLCEKCAELEQNQFTSQYIRQK